MPKLCALALPLALWVGAPRLALAQAPAAPAAQGDLSLGLCAESRELRALREAGREAESAAPGPATINDAAALAGLSLNAYGLDAQFAQRLQMPAFVRRLSPRVARELGLLRTDARARRRLVEWLRNAGRYRVRMEAILLAEGVPTELVWVVAAESDFDPASSSGAGAGGPWQLMPDTAREYGLRVDNWVDERRDPERSTRAAARFLRDLAARLGTWELALAAYHMGYNALLRSIRKYNTNDFDALAGLEAALPWETVHYVPRIIASAIAVRSISAFAVGDITYAPVATWEDVAISRSIPLGELARAAQVADLDEARLRALNPALLRSRTPPASYTGATGYILHVPLGAFSVVRAAAAWLPDGHLRAYSLRYGETVAEVAARYGLTEPAMLNLSGGLEAREALPATVLLTPDRDPVEPPSELRPVVPADLSRSAPSGQHRVYVRVCSSDDIAVAARALAVSVANLAQWNSLDVSARLQSGMWLQAFVTTNPVATARVWQESEVEALRRGSEFFLDRAVQREGLVRLRVVVRAGDTLGSLAERFGSTPGRLARINQRDRTAALTPGETVVVYTSTAHAQAHSQSSGDAAASPPSSPQGVPTPPSAP